MLSRRQLLASLGGLAAVGLSGAAGLSRLSEGGGEESGVLPSPSDARLLQGELKSRFVPGSVPWMLSMPPDEDPRATIFVLHGKGDNQLAPFRRLRMHDFATSSQLPVAIAAVDGGDSYWHRRRNGTDTMAMLLEEFVPEVQERTRTTRQAIAGWSMGGYGALLAMSARSDLFSSVTALSPALWTRARDSAPGAFDDAEDFRTHDVFARRTAMDNLPVQILCGNRDPFLGATKTFAAGLPRAQTNFGEGGHDDAYWRRVMPQTLRFLAGRTLAA